MKLASEIGYEFMEVFAKDNLNVEAMFLNVVGQHLQKYYH